ncbi:hypothetical protein NDU88_002594 [Pleurodeles waltl]|uniref:Secreted protein n=1 Tax=Pleurodeles waltl TaxID=8319 RepID=A0AAV7SE64_PLEWA|nr:hypothetical protein NDU88_002594 [Pleurodeles waltl]
MVLLLVLGLAAFPAGHDKDDVALPKPTQRKQRCRTVELPERREKRRLKYGLAHSGESRKIPETEGKNAEVFYPALFHSHFGRLSGRSSSERWNYRKEGRREGVPV